jgi:NAD(P)-dependent dehydrogenase (short-subunit alcohol dehydrogenase family)
MSVLASHWKILKEAAMKPISDRRTVLVTGGSRGLGRAIAEQFAADGYRVAVHFVRNRAAAEACLAALAGDDHVLVEGPIAKLEHARAVFASAAAQLGGVDVLINNAGVYFDHPPATTSADEWSRAWDEMIGVMLLGPAHLCHAAIAHMRVRGRGAIINISSRGAYRGEPDAPAYGAAKAGLNSLTQSLAVACAKHNISVYGIAPGWIETDMATPYLSGAAGDAIRNQSPLGRIAQPNEIARIALFLASDESAWMTGTIVDANGASYLH